MKTPTTKPEPAPAAADEIPAALLRYRVRVPSVSLGSVTAYCGASVNLTAAQAEALNTAQPGTVEFLGI